jgi:hypothetical protein
VRCLRVVGVPRCFGDVGLPGLAHHRVDDAELACLLADADGRISFGFGAALVDGGRRLRLGGAPGVTVEPAPIDSPSEVVRPASIPASHEYELRFDLDAPAAGDEMPTLARTLELRGPRSFPSATVLVAGPGAVREAAAVRAFAETTGIGVVNSWGAKGLFRWDDPLHYGTAGLQERDWELAGVLDAELVITVGVDPREGPDVAAVSVRPSDLAEHARRWDGERREPQRPALYDRLAAVAGPLYDVESSPAHAAAALAADLPSGGLVVADPGPAGFWIARTLPTRELGSVVVPASVAPGFAAAAAHVAGLDGRPALAVTTAPVDPVTDAVLGLGPVDLRVWGSDEWPVDFSLARLLVEVAGPVVAWQSA